MTSVRPWLDSMYARGQVTFTLDDARRLRDASLASTLSVLSRAQRDALLFSPTRGFYVIVPPDYRQDGAPPWRWFLAPMLRHLGAPYYVGLLTAAAQHGASPQAAQEIQVVVDRQVRPKVAGRQRIIFIRRKRAVQAPVIEVTTPTGSMRVATPEMTMLDLVAYPQHAAGWGNIASILPDLVPLTSRRRWRDALRMKPRVSEVQRLGHLLDRIGAGHTDTLATWLYGHAVEPTVLVPGGDRTGSLDRRWKVLVNAPVESD